VLTGVDNVFVTRSGDVLVAEDGGDLDIVVITPDRVVSRLLRVTGRAHQNSELAGPALNPAGDRLYFSSQRGNGPGVTYEVRGPFRTARAAPAAPAPPRPAPGGGPRGGGSELPATGIDGNGWAGGALIVAAAATAAARSTRIDGPEPKRETG
jgi:hypothetical protein